MSIKSKSCGERRFVTHVPLIPVLTITALLLSVVPLRAQETEPGVSKTAEAVKRLASVQQPVGVVTALRGKAQLTRETTRTPLRYRDDLILRDVVDTQEKSLTRILFGGTSILVRGYPQGLKNWDDGKLLLQIFDDIIQERVPGNNLADRLLASFACRSAIKAGQKLSVDEMRTLADQLFAVENPYSCPHGRPTIYRISLEDVERWFHRR